jgi:exopolysaccharide biosynthesis polyprenyl glycosylphosphotransferase
MGLMRALLEAALVGTAVCATIFTWFQPLSGGWSDVVFGLAKALPLSICFVVSFYYNDLYDLRIVPTFRDFASRLLQAIGVALILLAPWHIFVPGEMRIPYGALALSVVSILVVLVPIRALSYRLLHRGPFRERVLVLGRGPVAAKVLREIAARPYLGCEIVGVADDPNGPVTKAASAYPLLGPLEHIAKIIEETHPDRIILALSERRARLPVRQLLDARMNGSIVEDGVDAFERLTGKIAIESMTPSNLLFSKDFRKSRLDLAIGRITSWVAAAIGVVVTSPVFCLVALAIKCESPNSPLFFVQDRLGRRGRRFRLVKFRTMRVDTTHTKSEWVTDNSDRITSVGRVLRRFRLDELPQFWNVILGDMNLVGPRPHPVSNEELFGEEIPYYSLRAVVRPGITGWAQIRLGYANNLEEETEKMRYDLYYIKHLSFWLDLRILFDTVKIVLFGHGAQSTHGGPAEPTDLDVNGSSNGDRSNESSPRRRSA